MWVPLFHLMVQCCCYWFLVHVEFLPLYFYLCKALWDATFKGAIQNKVIIILYQYSIKVGSVTYKDFCFLYSLIHLFYYISYITCRFQEWLQENLFCWLFFKLYVVLCYCILPVDWLRDACKGEYSTVCTVRFIETQVLSCPGCWNPKALTSPSAHIEFVRYTFWRWVSDHKHNSSPGLMWLTAQEVMDSTLKSDHNAD